MLEWFSEQVFSLFMWDSPFLVNEISHSMLSVSFFFYFEMNYIWIQFLNKYVANSLRWLDRKHCHFWRLCLRSCFPYAWLIYANWSRDIGRKGRKNKSRLSFCVVFNFLCWSGCEEEGREEVSRDVTDARSDTFSRSSNGLQHSQYQIIL